MLLLAFSRLYVQLTEEMNSQVRRLPGTERPADVCTILLLTSLSVCVQAGNKRMPNPNAPNPEPLNSNSLLLARVMQAKAVAEATEARRALADAARPRSDFVATDPHGPRYLFINGRLQPSKPIFIGSWTFRDTDGVVPNQVWHSGTYQEAAVVHNRTLPGASSFLRSCYRCLKPDSHDCRVFVDLLWCGL